jgi:hypothetical protein
MKVEELILQVASRQSTFWQAVRVLNRSPRHVRRLIQRYRRHRFADDLHECQPGSPSRV